jgi:glycosyltransferase involved in cell wall biosynthesis
MSAPRISVVIPCYNGQAFIGETLASVLGQTYAPFEVLVIDDGSTDNSAAVAAAQGPPVRVVSQKNQGESVARNRGLDEARGDWVAFLDADDLWKSEKLARQVELIASTPGVVCVHSGFYLFGAQDTVPEIPAAVVANQYELETLLVTPLINTSTAMVRTGLPVRFPLWTQDAEDMIYFTELGAHGTFAYADAPLAGYRMHHKQQTKSPTSIVRSLNTRFMWLEKNQETVGAQRAAGLRTLLRQEVIRWLYIAKWMRHWPRYWALREYAANLDWEGQPPPELSERIYPQAVYRLKDWFDAARALVTRSRKTI